MIKEHDWLSIDKFNGITRVLEFKRITPALKSIAAARILDRVISINESTKKTIGMLLQYFIVLEDGSLAPANTDSINDIAFIPVDYYRYHVPSPELNNDKWSIHIDDVCKLSQIIKLSPKKCFLPGFGKIIQSKDPDFKIDSKNTKNKKKTKSKNMKLQLLLKVVMVR